MEQRSKSQRPPTRRIHRLMVANRGEIATRIISAARELGIETLALYTLGDEAHAIGASQAVQISSASSYLNIDELLQIVKEYRIDAIHPGYGFLSESDEFSKRMWYEAGAVVVGPGWQILAQVGDKAQARNLANKCGVPVLPGLEVATNDAQVIADFALNATLPIMIKAVDGGGGRGIRLVKDETELSNAVARAMRESPSGQVIAEKAATDGFHHIEVQIIGDGKGGVRHLWERECSIQRRYQKVIEIAPAFFEDRKIIARIVEDAMRIAKQVSYFSLGTFEFLVNPTTNEHYFLEVNPRLQVEHTITEQVTLTDVVQCQLLLSQGASFDDIGLVDKGLPVPPYGLHSIQLRVTAEDAVRNWILSTGRITSFRLPSGNGVRVDTCLGNQESLAVSADFDSLLAKVIVTSTSWAGAVEKAKRALDDTHISGVATNLDMLRAIVADPDFISGACDIQWLDKNYRKLVDSIRPPEQQSADAETETEATNSVPSTGTNTIATQIVIPFSGKLVEVAVDVGDVVDEDDVICVVQQMKMELEVRTHRAGRVSWVMEDEDGVLVSEGAVAAVIEPIDRPKL